MVERHFPTKYYLNFTKNNYIFSDKIYLENIIYYRFLESTFKIILLLEDIEHESNSIKDSFKFVPTRNLYFYVQLHF